MSAINADQHLTSKRHSRMSIVEPLPVKNTHQQIDKR